MSVVHSEIGASSYDRWGFSLGGCPGSVRESRGVEKITSTYAAAGTKAHEVAYAMLMGQAHADLEDPEEQAAVQTYVDYVNSLADATDTAKIWRKIEQKFDLSKYHPGLFGTADCVIYFYESKRLVVIDYKHGSGVAVEARENSQLMYYGLGAINALNLPVRELELVIVQPRCNHPDGAIRSWKTTAGRVMDFLADLIEDAQATEVPDAPLIPGEHCRWCPAKPTCPALREQALVAAREAFGPPANQLTPQKLADFLLKLPLIEEWIKGIREHAYREAEHGRLPPGFKLVEKRAIRRWRPEWDEGSKIAREFGLKGPEVVDMRIKSPAQVEKLIPKNLRARFDEMVVAESSGLTLVPESDGRREIRALSVRDVFETVRL